MIVKIVCRMHVRIKLSKEKEEKKGLVCLTKLLGLSKADGMPFKVIDSVVFAQEDIT